MSVQIRDQHDLDRLNIRTAWQFADHMTAAAFDELCRVTIAQVHHDAAHPEPCPVSAGADAA